jgi:hypothetical protein
MHPSRSRSHPRSRAARRVSLLVVALSLMSLVVSCSRSVTGPSDFSLSTTHAAYSAGDAVEIVVTNLSGYDVNLGACEAYAVDQRAGSDWHEVYRSPETVVCIALAIQLPAGGSVPVTVRLPEALSPAAYRVRLARFAPAATNVFEVR